jgi:ligand-binding SRPBCC domain-containing protein
VAPASSAGTPHVHRSLGAFPGSSIGLCEMPRIHLVTDINAPPQDCFATALDVAVHLASSRSERVVGGVRDGMMKLNDDVTWSARHFGVRWRMTSKIVEYHRPHYFVDEMQRGPFGHWCHQHVFEATDPGTRMIDDVDYASPFGLVGSVVDALVLEKYMTQLLRRHNRRVRAVAERGRQHQFRFRAKSDETAAT